MSRKCFSHVVMHLTTSTTTIERPTFYTGTATHFASYGFEACDGSWICNALGYGMSQSEANLNALRNYLNTPVESDCDSLMLYGAQP